MPKPTVAFAPAMLVVVTGLALVASPSVAQVHQNRLLDAMSVSAGPTSSQCVVQAVAKFQTDSTHNNNIISARVVIKVNGVTVATSPLMIAVAEPNGSSRDCITGAGFCDERNCNSWGHQNFVIGATCGPTGYNAICMCTGSNVFNATIARPQNLATVRAEIVAEPGSQAETHTSDDFKEIVLAAPAMPAFGRVSGTIGTCLLLLAGLVAVSRRPRARASGGTGSASASI